MMPIAPVKKSTANTLDLIDFTLYLGKAAPLDYFIESNLSILGSSLIKSVTNASQ
ncbi:unnamed protein product [Acidithrix sp. C25]|nr:unnamed protein product [Acidithrix sp. C25]